MNHEHDRFPILHSENHKQCRFSALKQHHSIEITITIILRVEFNFFGKNHIIYHLNNDKYHFNPVSIPFQSCFNHVFSKKSRKSHHDQQIVEKTYHNHIFVIVISIAITSRISWSLKKVIMPTFIGHPHFFWLKALAWLHFTNQLYMPFIIEIGG